MSKKNEILEILKGMDSNDILYINNEYCDDNGHDDDRVYPMEDLAEFFSNDDLMNFANRMYFGNDENGDDSSFNPNRDYFYYNGYGNLVSLDYLDYNEYSNEFMYDFFNCEIDSIIEWIIENDLDFDNDEIREILDK